MQRKEERGHMRGMRQGTEVEKPRTHEESSGHDDFQPAHTGFGVQKGPKGMQSFIVLGCSEKCSDPLVYLFFSFPPPEHIFFYWRLIYNAGSLLQWEQVFLWDEIP